MYEGISDQQKPKNFAGTKSGKKRIPGLKAWKNHPLT